MLKRSQVTSDKSGKETASPAERHWLNTAEIISVVGAVGGSVASLFFQQVLFAAIPLVAAAGLNLANRKRLIASAHTDNQAAIADLAQENVRNQITQRVFKERLAEVQHIATAPEKSIRELRGVTRTLGQRQRGLTNVVDRLRSLEEYTQAIRINPQDAEAYYNRGNARFYLGNIQGAIEDYNEAIRYNSKHAQALRNRSMLYRRLGEHKGAIEDLRKAAKIFLEEGNIASYQQSVDIMRKLYKLNPSFENGRVDSEPETLTVENLFSA